MFSVDAFFGFSLYLRYFGNWHSGLCVGQMKTINIAIRWHICQRIPSVGISDIHHNTLVNYSDILRVGTHMSTPRLNDDSGVTVSHKSNATILEITEWAVWGFSVDR
jgi:hypothetical protein